MLGNEESEGSLVFELSESKGAKIIVTPTVKDDDSEYTVEHLDVEVDKQGDE